MKRNGMLLRIGDVADMTQVSIHTLRYWENEFKGEISPCRSEGGQRQYSRRDIEKIVEIKRLLKEQGYSISGARRILKTGGREERSVLALRRGTFDWSRLAQEVTELIRRQLSRQIDEDQEERW